MQAEEQDKLARVVPSVPEPVEETQKDALTLLGEAVAATAVSEEEKALAQALITRQQALKAEWQAKITQGLAKGEINGIIVSDLHGALMAANIPASGGPTPIEFRADEEAGGKPFFKQAYIQFPLLEAMTVGDEQHRCMVQPSEEFQDRVLKQLGAYSGENKPVWAAQHDAKGGMVERVPTSLAGVELSANIIGSAGGFSISTKLNEAAFGKAIGVPH